MFADLRAARRALRAAPGYAAAAVLTLALGIALAAAMGTVARAVAFARLPVRDQDRVVVLWGAQPSLAHVPLRLGAYDDLAAGTPGLAAGAAVDYNGAWPRDFALGDPAAPTVRLSQGVVSGNFFDVLGARPLLGRALRPSDDVPGTAVVAVLSHAAWRRDFGGDPHVVGRTIRPVQTSQAYTIVGVMPPGLDYPRGAAMWVALRPMWADTSAAAVDVVARLSSGATPALAAASLTASYRRSPAGHDELAANSRGTARLLADAVVGDARPAFTLTAAAAGLVLLAACGNVAGLVRAFAALAPADLPRVAEVRVDGWLLAAAVAATAAVVVLVGLAPALDVARRVDVADVLRRAARGGTGGRGAGRVRRALVGGQVAMAVVVLASAGLLGRSLARLQAVDLGLTADRLALVELVPPADAPSDTREGAPRWNATLDRVLARVGALRGVAGVAPVGTGPFKGSAGWIMMPEVEGAGAGDTARTPWLHFEVTTGAFARTAGVPLLRGRFLTDADREGAPGAVVLSERAARAMWPGGDAVGKRVRFGRHDPFGWRAVVGVVAETRWQDLRTPQGAIYIPYRQFAASPTLLLVRSPDDPALLLPAVRRVVAEVAPTVRVTATNTLRRLVAVPLARPRLLSALLAAFALAAVALTAVGLFGVVAASVAERGRELAVRSSLGARPGDLRALVVGEGLPVAGGGAAVGLAAALALGRLVAGLLYNVRPADPAALGGSALALLLVCAAACLVPAARAARADPAAALRAE
ncbi:hypothetical protein tb265_41740 [Gemmatimonadetes bacterium T265]|nr:hypothetical protein tb265_41740 [Gemmatimonadetes bacterium T265]